MVGNRGPMIEGHHSLTPNFAALHTISATYNTTVECLPKAPGTQRTTKRESLTPTQGATQQSVD